MDKKIIWELDDHLDVSGLESIHLEICQGIARSTRDYSTRVMPHYEAHGDIEAALNYKNNDQNRISAVSNDFSDILTDKELTVFNTLNYNARRMFLELYRGAYTDGEFVRLRFTKPQNLKDKFSTFYSSTTEVTENFKFFPELISWINRLPFIDIGRILIFVTKHHLPGDLHYDRRDDWMDGRHHFIWFNPGNNKKFSIYDGSTEIPIKSKSAFFDTSYIHGSGKNSNTAYSLRIDGHLSKEFCDKAGILWRPR